MLEGERHPPLTHRILLTRHDKQHPRDLDEPLVSFFVFAHLANDAASNGPRLGDAGALDNGGIREAAAHGALILRLCLFFWRLGLLWLRRERFGEHRPKRSGEHRLDGWLHAIRFDVLAKVLKQLAQHLGARCLLVAVGAHRPSQGHAPGVFVGAKLGLDAGVLG